MAFLFLEWLLGWIRVLPFEMENLGRWVSSVKNTFSVLHVNMETEAVVAGEISDIVSSSVVVPEGYILILLLSPQVSGIWSCSLQFGVQFWNVQKK